MVDEKCATAYITQTDGGHISRAQMEIGADGSGKLVTQLRNDARDFAGNDALIINDGSPGIGCPVIASITASDLVLIITEPTQSGFDDFKRVAELCEHFGIDALACINKSDINPDVAKQIEDYCAHKDIDLVGRIPYDDIVIKSINALKPITDYPESASAKAISSMWDKVSAHIENKKK